MTQHPTASPLDWAVLASGRAGCLHDVEVTVAGWMWPVRDDYGLLLPEPMCCAGCVPSDPAACIEVFARIPIAPRGKAARLAGIFRVPPPDDPAGWRYQLHDARVIGADVPPFTRRRLLAAGPLLCLAAAAPAPASDPDAARRIVASGVTVDLHSHAGRILGVRRVAEHAPFTPVAEPMRDGGMAVICLATVTDSPVTEITGRRIAAYREPAPGELYAWSKLAFARLLEMVRSQNLRIVRDGASLDAARQDGPSVVIASEGADFLEGHLERVDEAYHAYTLRHLQLTHYRVNELGDIQTAPSVHGGLTEFGAAVVRRCNQLGIVVDVAHGTYDLVKRAASVTTKPLVLSHTSLLGPSRYRRLISPEHARIVAGTDGVIGIWPPVTQFPDLAALAAGMRRMVDVVGVDHVGLGSDMLGLLVPASFASYRQLPDLAQALLDAGFNPKEAGKLLGGNYARVFAAALG